MIDQPCGTTGSKRGMCTYQGKGLKASPTATQAGQGIVLIETDTPETLSLRDELTVVS